MVIVLLLLCSIAATTSQSLRLYASQITPVALNRNGYDFLSIGNADPCSTVSLSFIPR